MPSSSATRGAVLGVSSSGVIVATSTRSMSLGLRSASWSARRAASTASVLVRSSGPATRRSRMPVRRTIHSASTPMRSAIGPFGTTRSGSLWPRPTTRAVRTGATKPPPAIEFSAVRASGMDGGLRRGLGLRALDDSPGEPGEHLARADLDEATRAGVVHRGEGLAPAHGPHECARELVAHVLERLRRGAREDGESRLAELDVVERVAERRNRRSHRGRVERARHRQPDRALAELVRELLDAVEALALARQHDLAGGVVVRDH